MIYTSNAKTHHFSFISNHAAIVTATLTISGVRENRIRLHLVSQLKLAIEMLVNQPTPNTTASVTKLTCTGRWWWSMLWKIFCIHLGPKSIYQKRLSVDTKLASARGALSIKKRQQTLNQLKGDHRTITNISTILFYCYVFVRHWRIFAFAHWYQLFDYSHFDVWSFPATRHVSGLGDFSLTHISRTCFILESLLSIAHNHQQFLSLTLIVLFLRFICLPLLTAYCMLLCLKYICPWLDILHIIF